MMHKISARGAVGISCCGQSNRAGPNVARAETCCLIAQSNKARNEHRRRCEQDHRQRHLSRDKSAAKSMLGATSANGASALFQTFNQIAARTLPRRINSHDKSR